MKALKQPAKAGIIVSAPYRATLIQAGLLSKKAPAGARIANCGKKLGPSMAITTKPVMICKRPANLHGAPAANRANKPHILAKAPAMVDIWALQVSSQYKPLEASISMALIQLDIVNDFDEFRSLRWTFV